MECKLFVGEVETKLINSNLKETVLCNDNIAVKETEEHIHVKETNAESNMI